MTCEEHGQVLLFRQVHCAIQPWQKLLCQHRPQRSSELILPEGNCNTREWWTILHRSNYQAIAEGGCLNLLAGFGGRRWFCSSASVISLFGMNTFSGFPVRHSGFNGCLYRNDTYSSSQSLRTEQFRSHFLYKVLPVAGNSPNSPQYGGPWTEKLGTFDRLSAR